MAKQKATKACDVCGALFCPRGMQKRCSAECMTIGEKRMVSKYHSEKIRDEQFREKKLAYFYEWKKQNKQHMKEYAKARSRRLHKENREYFEEYRKKNAERIRLNHYRWRQRNKEKLAKTGAAWRRSETGKASIKSRTKTREKTDPTFLITRRIRARIKIALLKAGTNKARKTIEYLGMSGGKFMDYLLSHQNNKGQFNAANYGTAWVVDHIRPIASFDLSDEQQLKQAFHYSNCQPMDPAENLSKGCYWNGLHWRNGVGQKMPWCCGQEV